MKRMVILLLLTAILLSSCGVSQITRASQYAGMYKEHPQTLLIMPPINNSTNVEAKDLLYTSISRPLIEAGYYVISPLLAMDVLKAESAYDAELFIETPLDAFKSYFGADAVVFSIIDTWTKVGFGIQTNIRYVIRSTTSQEIIFDRSCNLYLDLSQQTGGNSALSALADLAASAIMTAATDHIEAARKANYYIFSDLPRGKYSPLYQKDKDYRAASKSISTIVR